MRLIRCVAVAMFLLMLLPSLSMASMQESNAASGRENTILVSELFISPNNGIAYVYMDKRLSNTNTSKA